MRLALCQINLRVGDVRGNIDRILHALDRAASSGADLAVLPEQAIAGYPAEDLLLKEHFLRDCATGLADVARQAPLPAIVGSPVRDIDVMNSAVVCVDGQIHARYDKHFLPNYAVFDEHRYFRAGREPVVLEFDFGRVGVTVCEDIWQSAGPASTEAAAGAEVIVNLSASPWRMGRGHTREQMLTTRAIDNVAIVALCNLVGGQDELVFDGHSLVVDHRGQMIARGEQFREDVLIVDLDLDAVRAARLRDTRHRDAASRLDEVRIVPMPATSTRAPAPPPAAPEASSAAPEARSAAPDGAAAEPLDRDHELWRALTCGLKDYVDKNGFRSVVLGLSGGIDSALVLALAVDALDASAVTAVTMPSRYTSEETLADARAMAETLGVRLLELPVSPMHDAFRAALESQLGQGAVDGLPDENLQARIRGTLLMAVSNAEGQLLLTTGNKSEASVGYMTLYGDMAGGFAPIKDLPKTIVQRLSEWWNEQARLAGRPQPIPQGILDRPPSAELRDDQRDSDSLPPYDLLDAMLEQLIEDDADPADVAAEHGHPDVVQRIARLVDLAEYKRRQAPPGIRVTSRAFGRDRRMPITNGYRPSVAADPAAGTAVPTARRSPLATES